MPEGIDTEELVQAWRKTKQCVGDDIAQKVALYMFTRKPTWGVGGYMNRVAFLHWKWGYHDGARWTGVGEKHARYDRLEVNGGLLGHAGTGSASSKLEKAAYYCGVRAPSPERQVEARELLRLADPRLIQAALNTTQDGSLGTVPGVSRQTISNLRHQFFARVGQHYAVMNGRRTRDPVSHKGRRG